MNKNKSWVISVCMNCMSFDLYRRMESIDYLYLTPDGSEFDYGDAEPPHHHLFVVNAIMIDMYLIFV